MSVLADKIRGNRNELLIWRCMAFVCLFALFFVSWRLSAAINREPIILTVDNDTYRVPKLLDFKSAYSLHEAQTELAVAAIFNRHPEALDNPKRLKRLFETKAYEKVIKQAAKENKHFLTKQIHQKVEIDEMNIISLSNRSVKAVVTGQLLRMGHFRGHPFTEKFHLNGQITFFWNQNMRGNGGFPTLVRDYSFEIKAEQD